VNWWRVDVTARCAQRIPSFVRVSGRRTAESFKIHLLSFVACKRRRCNKEDFPAARIAAAPAGGGGAGGGTAGPLVGGQACGRHASLPSRCTPARRATPCTNRALHLLRCLPAAAARFGGLPSPRWASRWRDRLCFDLCRGVWTATSRRHSSPFWYAVTVFLLSHMLVGAASRCGRGRIRSGGRTALAGDAPFCFCCAAFAGALAC